MLYAVLAFLAKKFHDGMQSPKSRHVVEVVGLVLAVVLGVHLALGYFRGPAITVKQVTPDVQVVMVDKPILDEHTLTRILSDPADKKLIQDLIARNDALNTQLTAVNRTMAESKSTGQGNVETVPATATEPATFHFKDWRLTFDTDTKTANYLLQQKYEVLTSVGRNKDGSPLSLTQLYEIGEKGERIPVASVSTVNVFADATSPHWIRKLAIQGGVIASRDSAGNNATGGVVALQWLKHGRTPAAEDVTYAILSPAFVFGKGVQDIGIFPVSINLGRIPHQPLSNLWFSPFISKSQRLGLAVSGSW